MNDRRLTEPEKNKLTKDDLMKRVVKTQHQHLGRKTTICLLTLHNGFEIVGSSAPADVDNFDAEEGKRIAYEDGIDQLWQLEGYLLAEKVHTGG